MHEIVHVNISLQDKTNGNMNIDISKTCRICLNIQDENNLSSIYDEHFPSLSILAAIKECFGVTLRKDVNLPNYICSPCLLRTFEAYNFKNTILNSEEMLNMQISNTKIVSDQTENEICIVSQIVNVENHQVLPEDERNDIESIISDHNYSKTVMPLIHDPDYVPLILLNDTVNEDQREFNDDHSNEENVMETEETQTNNEMEKKYSTASLTSITEKWWSKNFGPPYECKICERNYGTYYRAFYRHIRTHFVSHFPCRYCGKKFTYDNLIRHMRTHTNERRYKCELCLARFSSQGNLKRHFLLHTGEKPFVCEICGKGFNQKSAMQHHKETHGAKMQIVCEFCGKIFLTKSTYRSHKLTYHKTEEKVSDDSGDEEYKCTQCNIGFSKLQSLNRHTRIHDDSENIMCGICKAVFHVNFSYDVHMFLHEVQLSTSNTISFDCKFCFDTFESKEDFELHLLDHIAKPYECNHCNKCFASKIKLNNHLRQHSEEKPYICQSCNKSFKSVTTLRQHIKIHTGRKPYLCQICLRSFTQQQQLSSHMLTHTGEKKYVCQYCGKAFALNGNLTVHIRRHTGTTPFYCDICGKGFYDSSSRKKHVMWKHKNKNVKTEQNSEKM